MMRKKLIDISLILKEGIKMALIKKMIAENPELKEFTESDQYQLSLKLMDIRYDLSYSPEEAAELLGITLYKYVQLESGVLEIDIKEYKNIIDKLANHLNKVNYYKTFNAVKEALNYDRENKELIFRNKKDKYKDNSTGNNSYSTLMGVA